MAASNHEDVPAVTVYLVPEDVWQAQCDAASYVPDPFFQEGFVHCTHGYELALEVGNRYYRDDSRPYLALEVDLERVAAPVVYEDDARRYPHIYGPLERQSVRSVRRMERAADGTFVAIGGPLPGHDS